MDLFSMGWCGAVYAQSKSTRLARTEKDRARCMSCVAESGRLFHRKCTFGTVHTVDDSEKDRPTPGRPSHRKRGHHPTDPHRGCGRGPRSERARTSTRQSDPTHEGEEDSPDGGGAECSIPAGPHAPRKARGASPGTRQPRGSRPPRGVASSGAVREKKETGKCGLCRHSHTYNSGGKPKPAHEGVEQYRGWRTKSRGTRARPAPPGRSGSRGTHTRGRHFSARSPLRIHRMSVRERSPRELARRRSRSAVKQRAPRRTSARDIAPHRVPRSCAPRKCQKQRAPRRPSARHRAGRPHLPGVEARRASRGASAGAAPSPSPLARASRRSSR